MADNTRINANPQPSTPFGERPAPYSPISNGFNFQSSTTPNNAKIANMSDSSSHHHHMNTHHKTSSLRSLLSPPEPAPYDSFPNEPSRASIAATSKLASGFLAINATLPSPPVSPETRLDRLDDAGIVVRDPILYPHRDASPQPLPHQQPLFVNDAKLEAQRVVEAHISARAQKPDYRETSPPVRDDYVLALEFKSQVAKLFNANQRKWAARERSYLAEDERIRKAHQRKILAKIAPAPHGSKTLSNRIVRSPPKPKKVPRPERTQKATHPRNEGPGGKTPIRQPPTNGTTREDRDFRALTDYSPPLSTLPQKANSLKVDWKGAPIDLSDDPDRHLLHPDELALAANLRLDCATYLTSKRRIFLSRIDCLRRGKEFRKTDSQQACKIDVNKASKLWQAFDKVGWLDRKYFERIAMQP